MAIWQQPHGWFELFQNKHLLKKVFVCFQSRVWGVAFHLVGSTQIQLCLEHLGVRECKLGGYKTKMLPFIARNNDSSIEQITALTFIAMPENRLFLGPIDLDDMAIGIIAFHGESGSNVEYVIRMAEFMHDNIPEEHDEHLFELETKIRLRLYEMSKLEYGDSNENCRASCRNRLQEFQCLASFKPRCLKNDNVIVESNCYWKLGQV